MTRELEPGHGASSARSARRRLCAPASDSVLVMTADPGRPTVPLVASFRNEIEVVVSDVHHVDTAGVSGIRVEDLPFAVFCEDAQPLALRQAWILDCVVVVGLPLGDLYGFERDSVIEIELAIAGRDPGD